MEKRGKLEIMRDILNIIKNHGSSMKPTPLMRKSNLSTQRFKDYCSDLFERGLIREIIGSEGDKNFVLTERGLRFLDKYQVIVDFIDEFEL